MKRIPPARWAPEDGVTIYPIERLGNQLFTWAAGLSQARRLGCPLYVSLGFYRQAPQRSYEYHYSLDSFDSGLVVCDNPAAHNPIFRGLYPMGRAAGLIRRLGSRAPANLFVERSFAYDERIEEVRPGVTLLGYFQSWRYFADVLDEVKERLSALVAPSPWYETMCREIAPGGGAIVLHLRRTDYLDPEVRAFHGVATRAYYARALRHLRALGMSGEVYVMSDALEASMAELEGLAELTPIDPPRGTNPIESLLVLARADALVAGNSSFSWWGGVLGERPDRPVIAPRPWFSAPVDTRDLLLPAWLTLDREHEDVRARGRDRHSSAPHNAPV
jgi:hypothetical protein